MTEEEEQKLLIKILDCEVWYWNEIEYGCPKEDTEKKEKEVIEYVKELIKKYENK